MEIKLSNVYSSFRRADADGSGALSKKEIAQESLRLSHEGKDTQAGLFSTFVLGGNDGKGLFPDYYNAQGLTPAAGGASDGELGYGDIASLAAADGSVDSISSEDFKAKFADRAGAGQDVDIDKLKEIANSTTTSTDDTNTDGNSFIEKFLKLLPLLLMFMGGGQQPQPQPYNPFQGGGFQQQRFMGPPTNPFGF